MAAGDLTQPGEGFYHLSLLVARTSTNSAPSGGSAGVALTNLLSAIGTYGLANRKCHIRLKSVAGSDTMLLDTPPKLWGYDGSTWIPCGTGADSLRGMLNDGVQIGETATDLIQFTQEVTNIHMFTRLYVEITGISGTGTSIDAFLVVSTVPGDN